jgi:peptidoglycan/LPS O-acetylase OafA/YrhL
MTEGGNEPVRADDEAVIKSAIPATLGVFSYSLYLIHPPIVAICNLVLTEFSLSPSVHFACMLVVGTVVSVLAGGAFYCMIERRCLSSAKLAAAPTELVAPDFARNGGPIG